MSTIDPVELPPLCELQKAQSGEILGWDAGCVKQFMQFEATAEANTSKAEHNTSALRKSEEATRYVESCAAKNAEIARIRQDLLEQERFEHNMDNWFYRIIIVLGVAGAVL